jgi:hypothetical protein
MLWLSWILASLSIFGMWKVGSYKVWAWIYMCCLEVLWATYGTLTGQYGFILGAVGYMIVYLINYNKWKNKGS